MSCGFSGSKKRALSAPATSGIEDTFEATTGVPHCIASRTGSPNPSYRDGNTYASARLYRAIKSSSGTWPGKWTFGARFRLATSCSGSGYRGSFFPVITRVIGWGWSDDWGDGFSGFLTGKLAWGSQESSEFPG